MKTLAMTKPDAIRCRVCGAWMERSEFDEPSARPPMISREVFFLGAWLFCSYVGAATLVAGLIWLIWRAFA